MRLIDADALKEKKVYCPERHEKVVPVAEIDWMPTVEQPQWISVKDRMPEQAGCYLVYRQHFYGWGIPGQITVCYWDGIDWFDDYVDAEGYELPEDSVSHWMPLPDPPKEVKQE